MRMDQGGIWLNLIRLVSGTLKLNLITLASEEGAITLRPPHRHLGCLGENFPVSNCGMYDSF